MSSPKFASITSSLLARKGEAIPWAQDGIELPAAWRAEHRASHASPPPSPPTKERTCSVRMSAYDYERLGILAVKTGVTRQKLLKDALAQFLARKAHDYACSCLGACDRNCANKD